MKKMIIIAGLFGMFGWAVYDLVFQKNDPLSPNAKEKVEQEESVSGSDKENNSFEDEKGETQNLANVGLNVGIIAPDFQLKTLEGKDVKLSDYRGQRVMVNFWATWCPPCRAEMPDMVKFHKEKDIVILAVNLTQTESRIQEVKDFVEEFNVTFPVLLDEEIKVATQYQIRPIPTSYMIDSKGIIQYKALGALNYEMMVQAFNKMK
ncbi:TlpA disulfide reductase family protein [Bacillus sp. JJ722]|uniref:TlpA disulfide reductase family protein n=1 Tax=Bacillus sp. JJ722 TaxID=3122973 RepID=UPI00300090EF